jgi:hypothetical protein
LAKRGGRVKDNRSDRQKQMDEDFARIAQRAGRRDEEDEDDNDQLRAQGFGSSSLDTGAYNAGRAAAAHILGKSPSGPASYPATTAPRGGNMPPMRESSPAARVAPSDDATYSAGAAAARHLLGDTSAVRAEADAELRAKFAEQQARRAQQE